MVIWLPFYLGAKAHFLKWRGGRHFDFPLFPIVNSLARRSIFTWMILGVL